MNDTGCTYPLTTTAVTKALKLEIKPLTGTVEIIDASGNALDVLGTTRMFIDSEILEAQTGRGCCHRRKEERNIN